MNELEIPRTQFGGVSFDILWNPSNAAQMNDWEPSVSVVERHVPGSDRNVAQVLGRGADTLALSIELESTAELNALRALLGQEDTLILFAETTSAQDTYRDIHGEGYIELPNVQLKSMTGPLIALDGSVEVSVLFRRDPA